MKDKNESKTEQTTTPLDEKLAKLKELPVIMDLNNRVLSKEERQEYENIQFKMEFSLKELVNEFKLREADVKIRSMEEVIKLLKSNG